MDTKSDNPDNERSTELAECTQEFYALLSSVSTSAGGLLPPGFDRDLERGRSGDTTDIMQRRMEFAGFLDQVVETYTSQLVKVAEYCASTNYGFRTSISTVMQKTRFDNDAMQLNPFSTTFRSEFVNIYESLRDGYSIEEAIEIAKNQDKLLEFSQEFVQHHPYNPMLRGTSINCPATQKSIKRSIELIVCFRAAYGELIDSLS